MDWLNDLRVLVTLSSFAAFLGVVCWAYAPGLRSRFDADAAIPFMDDDRLPGEQDKSWCDRDGLTRAQLKAGK
jgi:cbb3-type cytochrome oxidase subunit 3